MQYGEDDLCFIIWLLGEVGIWFCFIVDMWLYIDVVEFCDSQQGYEKGLMLFLVLLLGQQLVGVDVVWEMVCCYCVVEQQVSICDYNYCEVMVDMNVQVDVICGEIIIFGEVYYWGDNYLIVGNVYDCYLVLEFGVFYVCFCYECYLNGQIWMQVIISCLMFCLGQVLKVIGGEEVVREFVDGVFIMVMYSYVWCDVDFVVEFVGILDSLDVGYWFEFGVCLVMVGMLLVCVISIWENDIYGYIDKYGCYWVNMLFDWVCWEIGFESLWVCQLWLYVGDIYGLYLLLLVGMEVVIGFEDGNFDWLYIVGVLYDLVYGDYVIICNDKCNVLCILVNNKICFDDECGKEYIKVSMEYGGKSQLNLGYLVDSDRQLCGEGFELRIDSWGVIWVQKGIFISVDGQVQVQGQVLVMELVVSLLKGVVNQVMEWGSIM